MVRWLSKKRDKDIFNSITSASTGQRGSTTAVASISTLSSKNTLTT